MKTALIYFSTAIVIMFVMAIFIYPDTNQEYSGFWYGVLHGNLAPANWIISFFDESRLFKAISYNNWYNWFWWLGLFFSIERIFLNPVLKYLKEKHQK